MSSPRRTTLRVRRAERPAERRDLHGDDAGEERRDGRTSRATARATPGARCRRNRSPGPQSARDAASRRPACSASTAVIQNGDVATRTAVSPLGTHCSANTTPPLPSTSIRKPSSAIEPHRDGGGSFSPRTTSHAVSSAPAMRPAQPAHQRRRHRLERDADAEIRRAPDQADGDPRGVGELALPQRPRAHGATSSRDRHGRAPAAATFPSRSRARWWFGSSGRRECGRTACAAARPRCSASLARTLIR